MVRLNEDNDLKFLTEEEKKKLMEKRKEGILVEENADIIAEIEYITE
jgi:hypothetical protein